MRRTVLEYGKLHRSDVGSGRWDRLCRFDQIHARQQDDVPAFDWSRRDYAVAQNRVGVLHVAGLTVEILPKVCDDEEEKGTRTAQANLLHMLHAAGSFPVMHRGMADVAIERLPLLDALTCVFARRLLDELTRGPDRGYVPREENLRHVKGRILIPEDVRRNAFLRHRIYVAYDEFLEDTTINRVLKAAARKLLRLDVEGARPLLTRVVEELDSVDDGALRLPEMQSVTFHRNNVRFEPLFDFARLVLLGSSPAPRGGLESSFALLFEMDKLFEAYFAHYVVRHAEALGVERRYIRVQARGTRVFLLQRESDQRLSYRLQPDLVVEPHGEFRGAVYDTKWKRIGPGAGSGTGPSQADVYQLAVYAARFGHPDNVLVYPATAGARDDTFRIAGNGSRVRFAVLRLDHDLRNEPERTRTTFIRALWGGAHANQPARAATR